MRVVARKFGQLIPVLIIVSILTFLLINLLPGNPVTVILGPGATPHAVAQLRHQLHLDQALPLRYWDWLVQTLHGNLGQSYVNDQPVTQAIAQHFPVTLELLIYSQVIALLVSIPLGMYSAYRPNGRVDRITTSASFAMLAIPSFILGVLLVLLFAVKIHLFPATGYTPFTQNPLENLRTLLLPSITLALSTVAVYVRVLRADMIATLREDFVTMARAKGMPNWWILIRHAFRPSTFSLVTVGGLNVGALLGGTFIVEFIFALPGLGFLTVQSIYQRDYLVVQACVLVVAVGYVLVNFLVDLFYPLLDPRTRHARAAV